MTDVTVESIEITDLGAQSRGNKVFGLKIGDDRRLSFEVIPEDYNAAATFSLIGVMEGIRHQGNDAVLQLPLGYTLTAAAASEGVTLIGQGIESYFSTWEEALTRINAAAGASSG